MHQIEMSSRWGAQLEGSCADLKKARRFLNGSIRTPASHFVLMYGDVPVLGTSRWDEYESPDAVYQSAVTELATIRAMIDLIEGCAQLEAGTIYEFQTSTNVRMWRKVNAQVFIPGPEKPAEDFAIMLAQLRHRPKIEQILNILVAEPSWPEIYRGYEALRDTFGNENGLKRIFPNEFARIERLRRTANEYRHFDVKAKTPDPMPYLEAVAYLKELVRRAISTIEPSPYTGPRELEISFSEYNAPTNGVTHLNNLVLTEANHNKIPVDQQ
ncbi:hypothetical protein [Sphingomonas sp. OTU376]|uniref:hypothetical protein n=1 Tax=Sphingomonas sp. OTU376 TaxID=3043863 RepID=UPI00313B993B